MKPINVSIMDAIAKNIRDFIASDTRSIFERAERKKPRTEGLKHLIPSLIQLMSLLFSLREQLGIINSTHKKFSVSDVTFYKFLQDFLPNEYMLFKKNNYFISKLTRIKKVVDSGLTLKEQFDSLNFSGKINGNTVLDLTLEDYSFFIDNYYDKAKKDFYKKIEYVPLTCTKREINPDFISKKYDKDIDVFIYHDKVETTLKDALESKVLLDDIKKSNMDEKVVIGLEDKSISFNEIETSQEELPSKLISEPIYETQDEPNIFENVRDIKPILIENDSSKTYKVYKKGSFEYKVYNTNKDREGLRREECYWQLDIFNDAKYENHNEIFPVITEHEDFPTELYKNKAFMRVELGARYKELLDDFIYVFDINLFHHINPDSYGLRNGLVIAAGGMYNTPKYVGHKCYRFYEGALYLVEWVNRDYEWSVRQHDQLTDFSNNDSTLRTVAWEKGYMPYLRKIQEDEFKEKLAADMAYFEKMTQID